MEIKCSKCQEVKNDKEFHNNKGTKNGKEYHCKLCRKNEVRKPIMFFPDENKKICSSCDVKKDLSDFTKNKNLSGGVNYQCRSCASDAHKILIINKKRNIEGEKICKKCNVFKKFTDFQKSITNKDGYTNTCKSCSLERAREIKRKRNKGQPRKKWSPYTTKTFKEELKKITGGNFELIGEYTSSEDIHILHKQCGLIKEHKKFFSMKHIGCTKCSAQNKSYLSTTVENELRRVGADYSTEVSFEDCIHKSKLLFDFAIYRDNILTILIEADGAQHFKEIPYFKEPLKYRKKKDAIKNKYCEDNNIPLLRVRYDLNEAEIRDLIKKYVEEDIHFKEEKAYYNRAGLTEKISESIKERYLEEDTSITTLRDEFNIPSKIIKNVLNYKYFPRVGLEFKTAIIEKLNMSKVRGFQHIGTSVLWGRLPSELTEEEVKSVINARKNGYNLTKISKEFNLIHKFIQRDFEWKEEFNKLSIKEKRCAHKETGKEFTSLADACRHFKENYKLESSRMIKKNSQAKFEYI